MDAYSVQEILAAIGLVLMFALGFIAGQQR